MLVIEEYIREILLLHLDENVVNCGGIVLALIFCFHGQLCIDGRDFWVLFVFCVSL